MNTTYDNALQYDSVAAAAPATRAAFIRKTYAHLAGAILAFIALETLLINSPLALPIVQLMFSFGGFSWLIVLGAFMGVSYLANSWANSDASPAMQYLGLALYVVAEAVIFLPLLFLASSAAGGGVILNAGIVTLALFAALTAVVFITRKDFSFLAPILTIGAFVAIGVIIAGVVFGFTLGLLFSAIMVLFAAGAILYSTSNVLHHYRPTQHVAASLTLFASVALLFWYIVSIFSSRD